MFLAQIAQCGIELLDDRQQLAGVDVRDASGDHDGILLCRDEAARQMLGQEVDVLLEHRRARYADFFGQPSAQGLD